MKLVKADIIVNKRMAKDTYGLIMSGDFSEVTVPGQFINIALPGKFLRRPFSVCNLRNNILTVIYKTVGEGTMQLSKMEAETSLDLLTGLGNGFNINSDCKSPLLIGGGAGVAPLFWLAEKLIENGKRPRAVLGFGSEDEIFMASELIALGVRITISTLDGSAGIKGNVTDALKNIDNYDYIYSCGPEPMLKAVYDIGLVPGEYSFEARMACGFGACMGCTCETKYGSKRICKDGPVLREDEIKW